MADLTSDPAVLKVRGPGDLIEAVPYLLGFHPRDSLVLIGLGHDEDHDRDGVTITARLDLADAVASHRVIDETVRAVTRSGAAGLVAVVFDDNAIPEQGADLPWRALVEQIDESAEYGGVAMRDALLVSSGRWWSFTCADPDCCPSEGHALDGASSTAAATATYAGLVALPNRDELARTLAPQDVQRRRAVLPLLEAAEERAVQAILDGNGDRHHRSVKRALFAAARDADTALFPGRTGPLTDEQVARFAVGLADIAVRDSVWLAVDQRRLDGRALWRELARRAPEPYDAAALFLFGWAEWRAGNGVLAGIAAERALTSDPNYTAAELLLGALRRGLDPHRTPRLRMPKSA
jgi:hypothetical protein